MSDQPREFGRVQSLMLRMIEGYQQVFSYRLSPCRFFPTCSEYGHEAIRVHGAGRGLWLTVRRLSRCRPFGKSGFDPVPEVAQADRPRTPARDVDTARSADTADVVMEKTT